MRPLQNWRAIRATQGSRTLNKTFVPQESNGCDRTGTNAPNPVRTPQLSVSNTRMGDPLGSPRVAPLIVVFSFLAALIFLVKFIIDVG